MRQNVNTPGGFFVGLGGIIAFCVVSSLVYLWVKNPAPSEELRQQQAALGLAAAPDAPRDEAKKKRAETETLLEAAAAKYNGGKKPDIDRLAELRGVVRFREAQKVAATSAQALSAPSSVAGKTVLDAAIEEVAKEIGTKKVAPSAVPLAEAGPADPKAAPFTAEYQRRWGAHRAVRETIAARCGATARRRRPGPCAQLRDSAGAIRPGESCASGACGTTGTSEPHTCSCWTTCSCCASPRTRADYPSSECFPWGDRTCGGYPSKSSTAP